MFIYLFIMHINKKGAQPLTLLLPYPQTSLPTSFSMTGFGESENGAISTGF